jgi:aminopeptidase-like protein
MSLNKLMDLAFKVKEIKFEGIKFKVRELSHSDFKEYQKTLYSIENGVKKWHTENVKIGLVKACLLDENGDKIFKDNDDALIDRLPERIINKLFVYAEIVNSMNETDEDKEKN